MGRTTTSTKESAGVKSVAVFNDVLAGDLVYRSNDGYGRIPDGLVATADFNINKDFTVTTGYTTLQKSGVKFLQEHGGGVSEDCFAQLSNGNYALVYVQSTTSSSDNGNVRVAIYDSTFTLVTDIATSITHYVNSTVSARHLMLAANPNGGFIVFQNKSTSTSHQYQVFNNDGTSVTAAVSLTSLYNMYAKEAIACTSTGDYIILAYDSTNYAFQIVTSTGTLGAYRTTTVAGNGSGDVSNCKIATRNDGGYYIVMQDSTLTTVYANEYDSSHTELQARSTSGSRCGVDAFVDGNGDLIIANRATDGHGMRILKMAHGGTSITTLSTHSGYPNKAVNTYEDSNAFVKCGVTSEGKLIVMQQQLQYTQMWVLDTDFTTLLLQDQYEGCNVSVLSSCFSTVIGTKMLWFFNNQSSGDSGTLYKYTQGFKYVEVDATGFLNIPTSESSATTVTAGVNLYDRGSSAPTSVSFLATTNDQYSTTLTPEIIQESTEMDLDSNSVVKFDLYTMPRPQGGFYVLYIDSTSILRIAAYDENITKVKEVSVASGLYSVSNYKLLKAIVFRKTGNIGIVYAVGSSTWRFAKLDENLNLIMSDVAVSAGYTINVSLGLGLREMPLDGFDEGFMMTGSTSDGYNSAVYSIFRVNASNVTRLFYEYCGEGTGTYSNSKAGASVMSNGDFISFAADNGYGANWQYWVKTSDTSWSKTRVVTGALTTSYGMGMQLQCLMPNQDEYIVDTYNSNGMTVFKPDANSSAYSAFRQKEITVNSVPIANAYNGYFSVCGTADGSVAFLDMMYSVSQFKITTFNIMCGQTNPTPVTTTFTNSAADQFSSGSNSACSIVALKGSTVVVLYRSTANIIKYMVVRVNNEPVDVNIQANVTGSSPVNVQSVSSAQLVGVSASAASAGDNMIVQARGTAQLNNSYSTSINEKFDFRSRTADGITGSASGRTIVMEE